MGNTAWAHIVVEIENNGTFCGGGKLKGRVLLDVREEIPAESLIFRFYGHRISDASGEAGYIVSCCCNQRSIYFHSIFVHIITCNSNIIC